MAALVAAAVQAGRAVLDAYVGDDRPVVLDDLRDALDDLSGAVDVVVGGGR